MRCRHLLESPTEYHISNFAIAGARKRQCLPSQTYLRDASGKNCLNKPEIHLTLAHNLVTWPSEKYANLGNVPEGHRNRTTYLCASTQHLRDLPNLATATDTTLAAQRNRL